MLTNRNPGIFASTALIILLVADSTTAQILGIGRESAKLTRLRPADVHLANQTIMVRVGAIDAHASSMVERMKKLIVNRMVGVNKNLREVNKDPYYLVDCSITRYEYNERTEKKKLLLVKEQGSFKILTASLEASYNVVRVNGNVPLYGGNIPAPYKKEFREGVETAPVKAEVEDVLIRTVVAGILMKLTNTEEKLEVRLMGKGGLSRFARLAQAGQWAEYVESLKALPEYKVDKDKTNSFEGDRHYDLSIAHEARFYDSMWKDYDRAKQYFDLADSAIRKARQYDPREGEYIKAQARLGQAKQYFDTIRERFPKDVESFHPESAVAPREVTTPGPTKDDTAHPPAQPAPAPGAMTNKDVIDMVNSGVSEKLIIEQINEAKLKQFDTSSRGIIRLTTAGVSEKVIEVIKRAMTRRAAPQRPKRKPARMMGLRAW